MGFVTTKWYFVTLVNHFGGTDWIACYCKTLKCMLIMNCGIYILHKLTNFYSFCSSLVIFIFAYKSKVWKLLRKTGGKAPNLSDLEFEARSSKDGAWYVLIWLYRLAVTVLLNSVCVVVAARITTPHHSYKFSVNNSICCFW